MAILDRRPFGLDANFFDGSQPMKRYVKTIYTEYFYYYYNGLFMTGLDIQNFFHNDAVKISVYKNEWVPSNTYVVDINNCTPFCTNEVRATKGDYILMNKHSLYFTLRKNLDDFEILTGDSCRQRHDITLLYWQYNSSIDDIKTILRGLLENGVDIDNFDVLPDSFTVTYDRGFKKLELSDGDYCAIDTSNGEPKAIDGNKWIDIKMILNDYYY